MLNPMQRFEEICNHKEDCKFCGGSGKHDYEKNIYIYGKSLKQLAIIIDYAIQHGYKEGYERNKI